MKSSLLHWALAAIFVVLMAPGTLWSESPRPGKKFQVHDKVIDLFDGMESGEIEVRFIPKDATQANVLIENKTGQPVTIRLPDAFAGVPVLAQFGGGGGGFGGGGLGGGGGGLGGGGGGLGGGGGGGGQGLGGGFGGGGGGLGGGGGGFGGGGGGGGLGGGGGGLFNVAAEKTGKIKVKTVCLEHGKDDPNPRLEYTIVPIDTFTEKKDVVELCRMLGRGELPQNTAQAAAWHLANDMSWEELANKDRVRLVTINQVQKFFTPDEIRLAMRAVAEVARRVEEQEKAQKSEKSDSLSNQSTSQTALKND